MLLVFSILVHVWYALDFFFIFHHMHFLLYFVLVVFICWQIEVMARVVEALISQPPWLGFETCTPFLFLWFFHTFYYFMFFHYILIHTMLWQLRIMVELANALFCSSHDMCSSLAYHTFFIFVHFQSFFYFLFWFFSIYFSRLNRHFFMGL